LNHPYFWGVESQETTPTPFKSLWRHPTTKARISPTFGRCPYIRQINPFCGHPTRQNGNPLQVWGNDPPIGGWFRMYDCKNIILHSIKYLKN